MRVKAPYCPTCLSATNGNIKRKTRIHNTKGKRRYYICDTCAQSGSFDVEGEPDPLRDGLEDIWLKRFEVAINTYKLETLEYDKLNKEKKPNKGKPSSIVEFEIEDLQKLVKLIKDNLDK